MNIFNTIMNFFSKLLGLGEQVAENKGEKIPMQKDQIEGKSKMKAQQFENKKGELAENGKKDDWVPKVELLAKPLRFMDRIRAKKAVKKILDAGMEILSIEVQEEKRMMFIQYKDGEKLHTKVIGNDKNENLQ